MPSTAAGGPALERGWRRRRGGGGGGGPARVGRGAVAGAQLARSGHAGASDGDGDRDGALLARRPLGDPLGALGSTLPGALRGPLHGADDRAELEAVEDGVRRLLRAALAAGDELHAD